MAVLYTWVFVGTDKNAGKTTTLNYIYLKKIQSLIDPSQICLASIGINGEDVDHFDGQVKPRIQLKRGSCFVTSKRFFPESFCSIIDVISLSGNRESLVLGRALTDQAVVLEGPRSKSDLELIRNRLVNDDKIKYFFIDGSVDFQFLVNPALADQVFYSILLSESQFQQNKVICFLKSLDLPLCDKKIVSQVKKFQKIDSNKVILLDSCLNKIYQSKSVGFLDDVLLDKLNQLKSQKMTLFLAGVFNQKLAQKLLKFKNLKIVLDNYSQMILRDVEFFEKLDLSLFWKPSVFGFFINRQHRGFFPLIKNAPVYNVFDEAIDDVTF